MINYNYSLSLTFIVLIVAAVPTFDSAEVLSRVRRIIGGDPAQTNEFRWVVSLQARKKNSIEAMLMGAEESYCGGTLIDRKWIVTAAHCVYMKNSKGGTVSYDNPKYWHIRLEKDLLKPSTMDRVKNVFNRIINKIFNEKKKQEFYHVEKVFRHPQYVPGILEHDIALLKIKEDIDFGANAYEAFLPLPAEGTALSNWPQEGQRCKVLGWGCGFANGPPNERVKVLTVPILSGSDCRQIYVTSINLTDSREVCAGYFNQRKGICPGDSGGPLACELDGRPHLAGVVSATHGKSPETYPGIFTRISYYAPWLRSIMNKH